MCAAIVARENNNRVVLRSSEDGDKITITAESGNVGNAYEEIEVAREGADTPVEIAFNAKYLTDVLGVLESEDFNLELTAALRPASLSRAEITASRAKNCVGIVRTDLPDHVAGRKLNPVRRILFCGSVNYS